jgi:hypothetical protein
MKETAMRLIDAYLVWKPQSDFVQVIQEDQIDNMPDHCSWMGACRIDGPPGETPLERDFMMFVNFNTLVVRDGIPAAAAHKAFLAIDEYRWRISRDTQGAQDRPAS